MDRARISARSFGAKLAGWTDEAGVTEFLPHDDWKPYMGAVLSKKQGLPERKTGLGGVAVTWVRLELLEHGRVGLLKAA